MTDRQVRTTMRPDVVITVGQAEFSRLAGLGLLLPIDAPSTVKAEASLMATHDIRTVFRPDLVITVSEDEYEQLLAEGLIYTGSVPASPTDYYDELFADKVQNGIALPAALRAAYAPISAPIVAALIFGGR